MLTPLMYVHIQWKAFVVYAVFCFVMAIVVHRYFPETMVIGSFYCIVALWYDY